MAQAFDRHRTGAIRSEFADDPDMVELVEEFASSMPGRVSAIRACCDNSDLKGLIHVSHQLKGAGGGYGFTAVSQAAGAAEAALRSLDSNEQLASIQREINELVDVCQRVRA